MSNLNTVQDPRQVMHPPLLVPPLPPMAQMYPSKVTTAIPQENLGSLMLPDPVNMSIGSKNVVAKAESDSISFKPFCATMPDSIPLPEDKDSKTPDLISGTESTASSSISSPTTSLPASPQIKKNIMGKQTAMKMLKAFNFTKNLSKEQKLQKTSVDLSTDQNNKVLPIVPKKKKKDEKTSVMEQIRTDETRLRQALGLDKLSQSEFGSLSHLNDLMDDPDAMRKFEEKGKFLREKIESNQIWVPTDNRESRSNRRRDSRNRNSSRDRRSSRDAKKEKYYDKKPEQDSRKSSGSSDRRKSYSSRTPLKKTLKDTQLDSKIKDNSQKRISPKKSEPSDQNKNRTNNDQKTDEPKEDSKNNEPPSSVVPKSWKELKSEGMSLDQLRRLNKKNNIIEKPMRDVEDIWAGLWNPKYLCPINVSLASDEKQKTEFQGSMVKETITQPSITFSVNASRFKAHYATRREAFLKNRHNKDVWESMEKCFNSTGQICTNEVEPTNRWWNIENSQPTQLVSNDYLSPTTMEDEQDTIETINEVHMRGFTPLIEPNMNSNNFHLVDEVNETATEEEFAVPEETTAPDSRPNSTEENFMDTNSHFDIVSGDSEEASKVLVEDSVVSESPPNMKELRALLSQTQDKAERKKLKAMKKLHKKAKKEKKKLKKEKKRLKKDKKKQKKIDKKQALNVAMDTSPSQSENSNLQENEPYCPWEEYDKHYRNESNLHTCGDQNIPLTDSASMGEFLNKSTSSMTFTTSSMSETQDERVSSPYSPSSPQLSESNSPLPMDIETDDMSVTDDSCTLDLSSIPTPPLKAAHASTVNITPQPVPPVSLDMVKKFSRTLRLPLQPSFVESAVSATISMPSEVETPSRPLQVDSKPIVFKLSLNKPSCGKVGKSSLPFSPLVEDEEDFEVKSKMPPLSSTLNDSLTGNVDMIKPEQLGQTTAVPTKILETISVPQSKSKDFEPSEMDKSTTDLPRQSTSISANRSSDTRKESKRCSSPRKRSRGDSSPKSGSKYSRSYRSRSRSPKRRRRTRSRSPRRSYRSGSPRRHKRSRSRSPRDYPSKSSGRNRSRSRSPKRPHHLHNSRDTSRTDSPRSSLAPPNVPLRQDMPTPMYEMGYMQPSANIQLNPYVDASVLQELSVIDPVYSSASNSPMRPSVTERLREEHGVHVDSSAQTYGAYDHRLGPDGSMQDPYYWNNQQQYATPPEWHHDNSGSQAKVIRVGNFLQVLPQETITPETSEEKLAPITTENANEVLKTKGLDPSTSPLHEGRISPLPPPSPVHRDMPAKMAVTPEPLASEPPKREIQLPIALPPMSSEALLSAAAAAAAASNVPFAHLISVLQQQNLLPVATVSQATPTPVPAPQVAPTPVPAPQVPPTPVPAPQEFAAPAIPVPVQPTPVEPEQICISEVEIEELKRASKERKDRKRRDKESRRLDRLKLREVKKQEPPQDSDDETLIKEAISEVPDLGGPIPDYDVINEDDEDEEDEAENEENKKHWHPSLDLPPPEKGILVIPSYLGITAGRHKVVKFADGVLPGDGTSTSGGEEIALLSPATEVAPKKKEKKLRKRNKSKSKPIKLYDVNTDGTSSPPPPPTCPPPVDTYKLYPGWSQCTFTAPDTVIIYTQPIPPAEDLPIASHVQCCS